MRDLIKTILKEQETDKLKNGIDVAIKLFKRLYPFVINWQYSENFEDYNRGYDYHLVDIDVICDIQKTLDFYNTDLDPYYKKNIDKVLNDEFPYPISITNDSKKMNSNIKYDSYVKFKEELNDIYGILPKDILYLTKHKSIRKINVDMFRFQY